jgi:hypothetical protein
MVAEEKSRRNGREQPTEGQTRADAKAIVEAVTPILSAGKGRPIELYQPFPVEALPPPCKEFVLSGAAAVGCDPAFVALPLLSALAGAIGNSRRIRLKRGWTEPAVIWTGNVGDSGSLKSPGLDLGLRHVRERQTAFIREWRERMAQHEAALDSYKRELAEWQARGRKGPKPRDPELREPACQRCLVSDTTVESLALLLQDAPRGLLLARDELAGWVGSFDQYKAKGKGGDAAHWLEMHRAGPVIVDRKSGPIKLIYVARAAVSVTGGIQPETLRRALGREHFEDGLAARLLLAMPPRRVRRWTEAEVKPALEQAVADVFGRLYCLDLEADPESGESRPLTLPLTAEGKAAWVKFFGEHAREHVELSGDLAAVWSKLEGYAARFALVLQCARWAVMGEPPGGPSAVGAESVEAGATLARWFGREVRRVYGVLAESPMDRERRRLLEWVQRKGGTVTARDVQRSLRRYSTAEAAEAALAELVKAGAGQWVDLPPTNQGGRPTCAFRLADTADTDTTLAKPGENGVVSASAPVDGAEDDALGDSFEPLEDRLAYGERY